MKSAVRFEREGHTTDGMALLGVNDGCGVWMKASFRGIDVIESYGH